jgi:PadR family transcriptional regulator, regulatory protein PadR
MSRTRRPSAQTVDVLRALAHEPREWRYGYDLSQELGIKAGSMYPILMRLADRGLLTTKWETTTDAGRPPRHLYRLSRSGLDLVAQLEPQSAHTRRAPVALRPEHA